MKVPAIGVLALWLAACGGPRDDADTQADVAAIAGIYERVVVACEAGDARGIAAVFADDAVYLPPSGSIKVGRQAIEARYRTVFDEVTCETEWIPEEIVVTGDWAYARGTFSLATTPRGGGETSHYVGRFLDILQRQADGSWKDARHMFSIEPAPAPSSQE